MEQVRSENKIQGSYQTSITFDFGNSVSLFIREPITLPLLYKKYPNKTKCLEVVKEARWEGNQTCPLGENLEHEGKIISHECSSNLFTPRKKMEYQCRECLGIYSPINGTLMHNTKIDLQVWFYAINKILGREKISGRKIAELGNVNKGTGCRVKDKIVNAKNKQLLRNIVKIINENKIALLVIFAFLFLLANAKGTSKRESKEKGFSAPPKFKEKKEKTVLRGDPYIFQSYKNNEKANVIIVNQQPLQGKNIVNEEKYLHSFEIKCEKIRGKNTIVYTFIHPIKINKKYTLKEVNKIIKTLERKYIKEGYKKVIGRLAGKYFSPEIKDGKIKTNMGKFAEELSSMEKLGKTKIGIKENNEKGYEFTGSKVKIVKNKLGELVMDTVFGKPKITTKENKEKASKTKVEIKGNTIKTYDTKKGSSGGPVFSKDGLFIYTTNKEKIDTKGSFIPR